MKINQNDLNKWMDKHFDNCEVLLENRVKEALIDVVDSYKYVLLYKLSKCQSPIEQVFMAYLEFYMAALESYTYQPQKVIHFKNNKSYRVDFLIKPLKGSKIVVECDGHDFHEKTKEQAAQDKKRDRDLISAGYRVLHFTGSEIYKDPWTCMKELVRHVEMVKCEAT